MFVSANWSYSFFEEDISLPLFVLLYGDNCFSEQKEADSGSSTRFNSTSGSLLGGFVDIVRLWLPLALCYKGI